MTGYRTRFWIESLLCAVTGLLAFVTLFWHDWIERTTGWDPDKHGGAVEWLAVGALAAASITFASMANRERRRRAAPAT
jgi:hypothetical protein